MYGKNKKTKHIMKKITVNLILLVCTLLLAYSCYRSIYSDIEFDKLKAERENVVKAQLMKIREAEEKFKISNKGEYCGSIDSLIDFIKNGRAVDKIIKEGELTDDQLESGLTEAQAVRQGIIKRDTVWVSTAEILGISNADSLKYVPVGKEGATIQLRKKAAFNLKSNEFDMLVEVRASLDDYLDGLDAKKLKNLKAALKKSGKNRADLFEDNADDLDGNWYGLRIGDLNDATNKMSGNWE